MKLHVIYDDRRFERFEPLVNELFIQNIDYQIWKPVEAKTTVESINKSHKAIVRWAKEMRLPMVAIGEDDLCFPAKDGWRYFLNLMPDSFDLYLACTYTPPITNRIICGFHCYVVHERFYDRYLGVPDDCHIDTEISNRGGDFKFCYPFAALQRPGFSANNMAVTNYNGILKPEDIYKG
jgi:hypothetical protein